MNRLEYIKLLKKTLGNIIDSTVSTIEELENISNAQFENNIIEYVDNMPFPPAVKEHIQKLEECNNSQASLLLIKTEQAKSLSSQLFMAKAAVKKQKALHKEDVDTLIIQILAQSLKETEFNKSFREHSAYIRRVERERDAADEARNLMSKELENAKSIAADSYHGLKRVESLVNNILHG